MPPEQPYSQPPPPPPPAPSPYAQPTGGPYPQQPYPYPPTPPRQGTPVWVWIAGGCGCLFFGGVILLAILFPVFSQARNKARQTSCISNVKQMGLGILMYMQDYDEKLPTTTNWMDKITPYIKNDVVFHCPEASRRNNSIYGYAFNSQNSGMALEKFSTPNATIMLYDSTNLSQHATDALSTLPNPERHGGKNVVGYLDGHVRPLSLMEMNTANR